MIKIIIVKRSDDYMAYLDETPVFWECAATEVEAIGKLIITLSKLDLIEICSDSKTANATDS